MLISTFVVTVLFLSSINAGQIEDKSSSSTITTDIIRQWLRQFHPHSRNRKIDFHEIFHSNSEVQKTRISNCSDGQNRFTKENPSNQWNRMKRSYFKENAIDNEADITSNGEGIQAYEDDGTRLDDQQERRVFNVEYHRPARKNFKIKDGDDSYLNDYRDEEINRNDHLILQENLSDDYLFNRNPDNHQHHLKIDRKLDHNGKKFREKTTIEKDFDDDHLRDNDRKRRLKILEQTRRRKKYFDKEEDDDSNLNDEENDK